MSLDRSQRVRLGVGAVLIVAAAGGAGYWLASPRTVARSATAAAPAERKILYWYDPMMPGQHFDKPGKSPFMDMQLQPRYAEPATAKGLPALTGVSVDGREVQNLGIRTAVVERTIFSSALTVTGTIEFNQRDVAIVQARSAGFVERVYGRAPGDIVRAGAPIADLLVPAWGGAQAEYFAVRRTGDKALTAAARQRLQLLGMPAGTIAAVERSGRAQTIETVTTPVGGAIQTLDVRPGMTVAAGQTLAQVSGLSTVWLNAAVPEASTALIRIGRAARATLSAWPGEVFTGRVAAILPTTQADSRTLTVRIELANRGLRLRPGMFGRVDIGGDAGTALTIPSEAVIRTGTRVLAMVVQPGGSYRPFEVRTGRESDGRTEIVAGLSEGQKVVASGQFLLDSEASLSGIEATRLGEPMTPPEQRK
jgi:Cu(I)/Ag(I) efflux system membrane fusion protein